MKDIYYSRPILYDYVISIIIIVFLIIMELKGKIIIPCSTKSSDFASDLGAIGLTVSGFILTLITILLTLKSGQLISDEKLTNQSSPFKIFLASHLYNRSVDILKFGVLSLVVVSIGLYIFKLVVYDEYVRYIFYADILGIIIVLATFLRCFYVIGLIMKMQKTS
jgi:hypothetical protein